MSNKIPDDERKIAKKRIQKKIDFRNYLFVWFAVSVLLVGVWFITTPGGNFWPVWAIGGMGFAALFVGWDAYGSKRVITEADIDAEVKKMNGAG
jgi:hypothetical protein